MEASLSNSDRDIDGYESNLVEVRALPFEILVDDEYSRLDDTLQKILIDLDLSAENFAAFGQAP